MHNIAKKHFSNESEEVELGLYLEDYFDQIKDRDKFKKAAVDVFEYEGEILIDIYLGDKFFQRIQEVLY